MARKRGGKPSGSRWIRVLKGFQIAWIATCVALAVGVLFIGLRLRPILRGLPPVADVKKGKVESTTIIYAADKDPATGQLYELGRGSDRFQEFVPRERIPTALRNATVAIEDERFYRHRGIDPWGIVRALVRNVEVQRLSEGASTITQQLVRNILLTRRKTLDRKLAEAVLALQLEVAFTKDQILDKYVNEVNYGGNIYGVGAAARYYFGKQIEDLSISECALLAGLPQRPSATYPFRHPDAALRRRDVVLAKMRELGYLRADQEIVERERPIVFLKNPPARAQRFRAPHFTNWVLRGLVRRHGKDLVYRGGLRIYTTLHWSIQQEAERVLREGVRDAADAGVTEGALVSMDPSSGDIVAMVGSTDYDRVEYNYALGRSQPGSTFKPIVYGAAFASGKFTPDSFLVDGPVTIGDWSPRNYGGRYSYGSMSIRSAVASSKNTIPVKVAREIGIDRVIEFARKVGIDSPLNRDLTLALGTCEVTPLEMNTAYCLFANGGDQVKANPLGRVIDSTGEIVESNSGRGSKAAVGAGVIRHVDQCLEAVVDYGTASGSRDVQAVDGARGKTGTTSDNKDAWFIGYSPQLVTTVYVNGARRSIVRGKSIVRYVPMQGVTGGQVCAPIWGKFMKAAIPLFKQAGSGNGDPFDGIRAGVEVVGIESAAKAEPASPVKPSGPGSQVPADPQPEGTGTEDGGPVSEGVEIDTPLPGTAASTPPVVSSNPPPGVRAATTETPSAGISTSAKPTVSGSGPTPSAAPPIPRTPVLSPTLNDVLICADNGLLANDFCPEALRRRLAPAKVPKRTCKTHGPRPDER